MTDIYRKFDPQTRRLTMVTPSAAGGVRGDSKALTLHFQYGSTFDINKYNCYITFDVLAYNKMAYTFSATTTPPFDGKTFVVPYEVMSRVRKNTLGYQIAFLEKDSEDPEFTQSQEDHLTVADTIDLKVILDPLPEYWINFFRENALVAPPKFDETTRELTFKTATGKKYTLKIGSETDVEALIKQINELNQQKFAEIEGQIKSGDVSTLKKAEEQSDKSKTEVLQSINSVKTNARQYTDNQISALKTEFSGIYTVRGSSLQEDLPKNPLKGDVYNIIDSKVVPAGSNVVWTGTNWDKLSETVDLSPITASISSIREQVSTNKDKISLNSERIAKQSQLINEHTDFIATHDSLIHANEANISQLLREMRDLAQEIDESNEDIRKVARTAAGNEYQIGENRKIIENNLEQIQKNSNQIQSILAIISKLSRYTHTQSTPSMRWRIIHNLNRYPQVQLQINNKQMYGQITQVNENELTISFNKYQSGIAILE